VNPRKREGGIRQKERNNFPFFERKKRTTGCQLLFSHESMRD
jgi:hypothetical protein